MVLATILVLVPSLLHHIAPVHRRLYYIEGRGTFLCMQGAPHPHYWLGQPHSVLNMSGVLHAQQRIVGASGEQ